MKDLTITHLSQNIQISYFLTKNLYDMQRENKKDKGPTCACGKVDLYEEMLKNENNKEEADDSTGACQIGDDNNSADDKKQEDQKQTKD